jgi:hypothetical protein
MLTKFGGEVSTKSRRANFVLVHIEISGSHGLGYSAYGCLVCDTVKFGRCFVGSDSSV